MICTFCENNNTATHNIQSGLTHYRIDKKESYTLLPHAYENDDEVNAFMCDSCYNNYKEGKIDLY